MMKISVTICCMNNADTIAAACESASWADEVIVVDSGSTDGTQEIAKKYTDKVVDQPWLGFTEQYKYAATLAKNDWVFQLDSDEEISPKLIQELQSLTEEQLKSIDVAYMPRRNYIMGHYVRAWSSDKESRLIHRDRTKWRDEVLHITRLPSDPSRVMYFKGWLEHKRVSEAHFSDYFSGSRLDSRLMKVAEQMYSRGKRAGWTDLLFRPYIAFLKFYVFKRGFLDGSFGLLIAQKASVSVQLKYAALWAVQQKKKQKND